jgi:hypothetical protein
MPLYKGNDRAEQVPFEAQPLWVRRHVSQSLKKMRNVKGTIKNTYRLIEKEE